MSSSELSPEERAERHRRLEAIAGWGSSTRRVVNGGVSKRVVDAARTAVGDAIDANETKKKD
jgi:hypothetical protein